MLPSGVALPELLAVAAVSAILAKLVNNLPATLILVPATAPSGAAAVLAVLVGVNVGPNLTYIGSLATPCCGDGSCTSRTTRWSWASSSASGRSPFRRASSWRPCSYGSARRA